MANTATKMVRRSISVPKELDKHVQQLAEKEHRSANQVYQMVIEKGLETKEAEKRRFFKLAERLQNAKEPAEIEQLTEELARLTFGS